MISLRISDARISWIQIPASNDTLRIPALGSAVKEAYSVLWKGLLNSMNVGTSDDSRALGLSNSSKTLLPSDLKALGKLGDGSPTESQYFPSTSSRHDANRDGEQSSARSSIIWSTLQWIPLPKFGPGTNLHAACLAFKQQINERRMRDLRALRRGTFSVRGPVNIEGSLGCCIIEVEGLFDPFNSEWVSVSMQLKDSRAFR